MQLSYAIGQSEPISVLVESYGTSKKTPEELSKIIRNKWDLTPYGMIQELDLLKPFYRKTSVYGHFGQDEFNWGKTQQETLDYKIRQFGKYHLIFI